jgi:hypothetical protein
VAARRLAVDPPELRAARCLWARQPPGHRPTLGLSQNLLGGVPVAKANIERGSRRLQIAGHFPQRSFKMRRPVARLENAQDRDLERWFRRSAASMAASMAEAGEPSLHNRMRHVTGSLRT